MRSRCYSHQFIRQFAGVIAKVKFIAETSIESGTLTVVLPILLFASLLLSVSLSLSYLISCQIIYLCKSNIIDMFAYVFFFSLLLPLPFSLQIRHMTARCLATLALINSSKVMDVIVKDGLMQLQAIENVIYRQGAVEAISCIVNKLQFEIVPYVLLLIIPLLGRMSDPDKTVRLLSTHCFATLIQLMPLDSASSTNDATTTKHSILSKDLQSRKTQDEVFLECLFSPKKIPNFHVPVPIDAELRSYQQSGVNWLWFLNKYKLHGILADDMGLGMLRRHLNFVAFIFFLEILSHIRSDISTFFQVKHCKRFAYWLVIIIKDR